MIKYCHTYRHQKCHECVQIVRFSSIARTDILFRLESNKSLITQRIYLSALILKSSDSLLVAHCLRITLYARMQCICVCLSCA